MQKISGDLEDYLEHFDTDELLYWTSRSCIPLNEIDFFMAGGFKKRIGQTVGERGSDTGTWSAK